MEFKISGTSLLLIAGAVIAIAILGYIYYTRRRNRRNREAASASSEEGTNTMFKTAASAAAKSAATAAGIPSYAVDVMIDNLDNDTIRVAAEAMGAPGWVIDILNKQQEQSEAGGGGGSGGIVNIATDCLTDNNVIHNFFRKENDKGLIVTMSETIVRNVFKDIIIDSGGNQDKIKENVRLGGINFSILYRDGIHRIAVDYQTHSHQSVYPNIRHKNEKEFEDEKLKVQERENVAADHGIYLITVPYTVDRCVEDSKDPSGWRIDSNSTYNERYNRVKSFISSELLLYRNFINSSKNK